MSEQQGYYISQKEVIKLRARVKELEGQAKELIHDLHAYMDTANAELNRAEKAEAKVAELEARIDTQKYGFICIRCKGLFPAELINSTTPDGEGDPICVSCCTAYLALTH